MKLTTLHDVLVDGVRDLYHAEKQLIKALPRMARAAQAPDLRTALEQHLAVTEAQAERLEAVFGELNLQPRGKTCRGMQGIIEEGGELLEAEPGSSPEAIDAAIIAAAQKVEHYEMSAYGSARAHAQTLGLERIAQLLQATLDEESQANEQLTCLAEKFINSAAVHPPDDSALVDQPARKITRTRSTRAMTSKGSKSSRRSSSRSASGGRTTRSAGSSRSGTSGAKRGSGKRERISPRGDTRFVRRDSRGRITESDDAGRSLAADRRTKARAKAKSGYGDRGD